MNCVNLCTLCVFLVTPAYGVLQQDISVGGSFDYNNEDLVDRVDELVIKLDRYLKPYGDNAPWNLDKICAGRPRVYDGASSARLPFPGTSGTSNTDTKVSRIESVEWSLLKQDLAIKKMERSVAELNQSCCHSGRTDHLNTVANGGREYHPAVSEGKGCSFSKTFSNIVIPHLLKVKTNAFLHKPANSSSVVSADINLQVNKALDDNFISHFHSKHEKNPWLCIDLQTPHFIWEIRVTSRDLIRTGAMQIYMSDKPTFLAGGPDLGSFKFFASQNGQYHQKTVPFRSSEGLCGRYVLIIRPLPKDYLILHEIQGTGYEM